MKTLFEQFKLLILLYGFWLLLTLDFQLTNLIIGIMISFFITVVTVYVLQDKDHLLIKIPSLYCLLIFFIRLMYEMYKSSFTYIIRIIKKECDPEFVKVKLNTTDPLIITMIANAITLTPGTLTVDVNQNELVVLSIDDPNKKGKDLTEEIKKKYEHVFSRRGR